MMSLTFVITVMVMTFSALALALMVILPKLVEKDPETEKN